VEKAGGTLLSAPGELPSGDAGDGNRYVYTRTSWGSTVELATYPSAQAYEAGTRLRRWRPAAAADPPSRSRDHGVYLGCQHSR